MSANSPTDRPSDGAIVERALSLANEAMFTIRPQHRRLRTDASEDKVFFFRRGADFQFIIVALRRLRLAAELAIKIEKIAPDTRTTAADVTGNSHMFRHTFATVLLARGIPIEDVSIRLGHKAVRITESYYSHWLKARRGRFEERVPELRE